MASSNENIVTGKKYRVFKKNTSKWNVYSFWTKASDVEMSNGQKLETVISSLVDFVYSSIESIEEMVSGIDNKQDKTDSSLNTTSKQVVGAINEINTELGYKVTFNGNEITNVNFGLDGTSLNITIQ